VKLRYIRDFFIEEGIKTDPRGLDSVKRDLLKRKKEYDDIPDKKKEYYDIESLTNPYYDSRILYGDENIEVENIMVGIDIEGQEVLLAKQLIDLGGKIDLIVAHHPEGYAYSTFYNIIGMHADILGNQGVPINVADKIVCDRIKEIKRGLSPQNTERIFDMARLLNIPIMTAHTVADNHVTSFLQKEIDLLKPTYLKEIIELLFEYPEYKYSSKIGHAPFILNGDDYSRCGKIFVDMTGGTEGPNKSFEKLEIAGVGTIVSMHLSPKGIAAAEKHHINVVLAGHISSDNLGMNLLFDKLEKKSQFEFIECSGFKRFRR
jgi:hypothetical protein